MACRSPVQHHLVVAQVLEAALLIQMGGPLVHLGDLQTEAAAVRVLGKDPLQDLPAQAAATELRQEIDLLNEDAGPAHLRGVTQGDIQIARQPAFLEDQVPRSRGSFPAAARKDRSHDLPGDRVVYRVDR